MKKRFDNDLVPSDHLEARQQVAAQLRMQRQELHLTQQVVADRAGTKKSNISRMESGRYNPSLDFLVKVAHSLGKEVEITLR